MTIINCYYGAWAAYRTGNGKFQASDINPQLCTHITYSFFGISQNDEIKSLDEHLDYDQGLGMISKTISLKRSNPRLKVMAAVGGWNEGSEKFSAMVSNYQKRSRFISSVVKFLHEHNFDGLDLDWEYPAQRGGCDADKTNFVTLLKELKAAFQGHGFILSIAVGASESTVNRSYDVSNICRYVDYINVMTYDFATSADGVVGFNAPLNGDNKNNVVDSIKCWQRNGAPPSKLVLGIGFYGHSFQLANNQSVAPGSRSTGPGSPGPYLREAGSLGYNEICENINSWHIEWDSTHSVPYAYKGNQWVSFDNKRSIELKMDFVKSAGLGGAMAWSIETDDFRGVSGETFPLLKTIRRCL